MSSARSPRVLIVGAGFGGIGAAIDLRRSGIRDVTILEKADGLGGTWLHNTYPGAACDVPSHFYSFSYAQRKDWTRLCPMQADILGYLRDVARDHGVDALMETGVQVTDCTWDADAAQWVVTAAGGRTWEADALVLATGQLHQPAYPRLEGSEAFEGRAFHSAEWDHDYPLAGKRVAVIGTGASAVQFVPEIAAEVGRLTIFQRTGNWFMPRKNRPYPAALKALVRVLPGLQRARRRYMFYYCEALTSFIRNPRTAGVVGRARAWTFMRWQLRDRELRRRVWPDYTFGCKRVLFSSHWFPALARENVDLETGRIARLTATGVETEDGRHHEVDCVIYGTGFKTTDFMFPMEVHGTDGRSLREEWSGGAHAHLGLAVPGFPNLWIMYGPNTNTSGGSIITYLEAQARYLREGIQLSADRGLPLEVRPEVEAASDRALQADFAGTAWNDCNSWYRTAEGRLVTNWPLYMKDYLERTAHLDPAEYRSVVSASEPAAV